MTLIASLGAAFFRYDRLTKIARAEAALKRCQEFEAKVKQFTGDIAERAIWDAEDETKRAENHLQSLKRHIMQF